MSGLSNIPIEEGVKTANGLLTRIFGPAADGLGIILSQGIKLRSVQNQIRGLEKLKNICDRDGIKIGQVNLKVLFPYLEGIAREEEPELEELWANLMANYLDSEKNLIKVVFPEILKQLSAKEANILKTISQEKVTGIFDVKDNNERMGTTYTKSEVCNLERLGLIKEIPRMRNSGSFGGGLLYAIAHHVGPKIVVITEFGKEFLEACERPKEEYI